MHERQISKSYDHNAITKIVTSCLIMTDMKIYAPCLDKCEWEKNPMSMIVRLKKGSNNASTRRALHWSHEEYRAKKKKIIILLASEDNTEEQKKKYEMSAVWKLFLVIWILYSSKTNEAFRPASATFVPWFFSSLHSFFHQQFIFYIIDAL